MRTTTTTGNHYDVGYLRHRAAIQRLFETRLKTGPLFTTNADPDALWNAYLNSFEPHEQQYHNCNACRRFIQAFAGLVVVGPDGKALPAVLDISGFDVDSEAIYAMYQIVKKAAVTGVFISSQRILGTPTTGAWNHVAVELPAAMVHNSVISTPFQIMAEKKENFKNVLLALAVFPTSVIGQAVGILAADALYRADKVLEPARWLYDLAQRADAARGAARNNVIWNAVATAPNGFCHPRSSMIGTLLEDLKIGVSYADASRRFAEKMHPLRYQRPQAAPTAGNVARAEKIFETLGIQASLGRRFARLGEVPTVWTPTEYEKPKAAGLFGHLVSDKKPGKEPILLQQQNVTAVKFLEIIKTAVSIQVEVPRLGSFYALLTAQDESSRPLFRWGTHLSWYTYSGPTNCTQWNLSPFPFSKVTAIVQDPAGNRRFVAILEGCKDTRTGQGNAIFSETLIHELREVRSTIEAYSLTAKIEGIENASACGLYLVGAKFRVTDANNVIAPYFVDRLD